MQFRCVCVMASGISRSWERAVADPLPHRGDGAPQAPQAELPPNDLQSGVKENQDKSGVS